MSYQDSRPGELSRIYRHSCVWRHPRPLDDIYSSVSRPSAKRVVQRTIEFNGVNVRAGQDSGEGMAHLHRTRTTHDISSSRSYPISRRSTRSTRHAPHGSLQSIAFTPNDHSQPVLPYVLQCRDHDISDPGRRNSDSLERIDCSCERVA